MASLVQSGAYTRRPRRVIRKTQLLSPVVTSSGGDVAITAVAASGVSVAGAPGIDATVVITGGGPATATATAPKPSVTACSTYT